jgi:uncharacterized protein YegL
MSAVPTSPRVVMRIIEGITALCLGSAENLVWVDEIDAAAFSDGEHLYLPRPLGFHEEEYGLLLALALREVARIWHSKPEAFDDLEPGVLAYSTLVEEVRLKMYLARTFRGAPAIFGTAAAIVCQQRVVSLTDDPAEVELTKALLVWATAHAAVIEVPALAEGLDRLSELVRQHVGEERVLKAKQLAQGAGPADSTEVAIALGAYIWSLLHPQQPPEEAPKASSPETGSATANPPPSAEGKPEAGPEEGDQPDSGTEATGEPAAEGTTEGTGGESDEAARGTQPMEDTGKTAGSPQQATNPGEAGPDEPSPGSAADREHDQPPHATCDPLSDGLARLRGHTHAVSYRAQAAALRERGESQRPAVVPVSKAGQAMLAALLNEPEAARGLLGTTIGFEIGDGPEEEGLTSQIGAGGGLPQHPDQAGRTLLDAIPSRLVTVLLRELQDVRRKPFQHSVTGPKLAAAKLWRLSRLGDTRLFRNRTPSTGIDAAVSLLLDRSASMQRNGFEQAVEVTQAFLLALQRIDGVRTSLDVFPGTDTPIEQVLAFGQTHHKARDRLRELEPQGGTPTGSAIARRLRQMLDVVAQTKLMVVVTDGQPDRDEVDLMAAVLVQAAMFQVQVVGIGIGVDLQRRFPASVSVRSVSELPDAMAELFRESLLHK